MIYACATPKKISIKENKKKARNILSVNTIYRNFELGIVLGKPFSLGFGQIETIINLSIFDNNDILIWKITLDNPKSGSGYIKYGKIHRAYRQEFPDNNQKPEDLKFDLIYKLILETDVATYNKEFLYQPGEIYILNSDKVTDVKK